MNVCVCVCVLKRELELEKKKEVANQLKQEKKTKKAI